MNMTETEAKVMTSVRLSADTKKKIAEIAKVWGIDKTEAIRIAVDRLHGNMQEEYLAHMQEKIKEIKKLNVQ